MPLEILTVPCLSDNYAFVAHDPDTGTTAIVDAPEAAPLLQAIADKGWSLDLVLLTHHHWDHVDGLPGLLEVFPDAKVVGSAADSARLPALDTALNEGDTIAIGSESGTVIDVSGHTINHIAFHFPGAAAVFTADSLMALGCGRVFEGTKPQMWDSLCKLAALPADTIVYSGHEYTSANAAFAISVDPDNQALQNRVASITQARNAGKPTVPSSLSLELATNPFLRANDPELAMAIGMQGTDSTAVFTEIRTRKDAF